MMRKTVYAALLLTTLSACSTKWSAPGDECVWTKRIDAKPALVVGSRAFDDWRYSILLSYDSGIEAAKQGDAVGVAIARAEIEEKTRLKTSVLLPGLAGQIAAHNLTRGRICDGTSEGKPITH
jgi:hypothetical protein